MRVNLEKAIAIKVPVRRYVHKYLLKSGNFNEPFLLSKMDPIGIMLINLLLPVPADYNWNEVKRDQTIEVLVGAHYARNKGLYIDDHGIYLFNLFMDKLIKNHLFTQIDIYIKRGWEANMAIRDFQAEFDFDESELSFDNLQRSYYRNRNKK